VDKNKDPDEAETLKKIASEPTSDPDREAAIELYAIKSFQAQDMSGVFNQARMDAAIRAAKPKLGRKKAR